MKISLGASNGRGLSKAPFPFQQTYVTPLKDLHRFVNALLAPFEVGEAAIWIETIVFTPNDLIAYLQSFGITTNEGELNQAVLSADSPSETRELLEHVLGDWIDFAFIPSSKTFAIYADHDEFTTIFTASPEVLALLQADMKLQGFKAVENWTWTGPRTPDKIEEGINV
jgi:hypothetical protein